MKPRRIQRQRAKGWKMPANAVYVGRPGRWGNPFDWMTFGREVAVEFFRDWLTESMSAADRASTGIDILPDHAEKARRAILDNLSELRGKNLACWCPLDQPCHADVLLELANAEPPK